MLKLSESADHSWRRRLTSQHHQQDVLLQQHIRNARQRSKGRYGAPRIHADLQAAGLQVSRKRVARARLMQTCGLQGKGIRRFVRTTQSDASLPVCPNLLNREFDVPQPNTVFASDITYIPTRDGWLYLAVTLDLYSRAVVGYAMDTQMPTALPLLALQMAVAARRPPPGLIDHSDRGSQYASGRFQAELRHIGARGSMSCKGDCWDNAVLESFFSSLKRELLDGQVFESRTVARRGIFESTLVFYNRQRRHSSFAYLTPVEFERQAEAA